MKEIKQKENKAKEILTSEKEFKGYTIEEIRFQRALVAMEVEFSKAKLFKSWNNIQKLNPLSPTSGGSIAGKTGSLALKLINGLSYVDYVMLGWSAFSGVRKVISFFHKKKK